MAIPPIIDQLTNLASESAAIQKINTNLNRLAAAFTGLLSTNTTPNNTMGVALDMNSNRVINLPAPFTDAEPARLRDLNDRIAYIISLIAKAQAGGAVIPLPTVTVGPSVVLDNYAISNQTTWDAAFIAACLDLPYGGTVNLSKATKNYVFTNLNVPKSITIRGLYETPPFPGTNQSLPLNGLQFIRLKTGGTISLGAGSGIKGITVAPENMSFPQPNSSSWSGTAVTIVGDSALIENVLIVGFGKAVTCDMHSRYSIRNLFFDCQSGLYLRENYDTARIYGIHGWPFATIETYANSHGSGPDGYDPTSSYRPGVGLELVANADDTQIDGVIMVGYQTGLYLNGCVGARIGRFWSECYALPNTTGVRVGVGSGNNTIQDLELWNCANPLLSEMAGGNELQVTRMWVEKPGNHAINVQGGNIHIGHGVVRGLLAANAVININTANAVTSRISGHLVEESSQPMTQSAIIVPANYPAENLSDLKLRSTYRAAGGSLVGGNPMISTYVAPTSTDIALPPTTDKIKIGGTGGKNPATMSGGYHGRRVTITWNVTDTLYYGATGGSGFAGPSGVTSRPITPGVITEHVYDAEYQSWREVLYTGPSSSGGTGGDPNAAWVAFTPTLSTTGGAIGGYTAQGWYFKNGRTVQVRYRLSISSVGSASGILLTSLPFASSDGNVTFFGSEIATTGKAVTVRSNSGSTSSLAVVYYDNATGPLAAGTVTVINGTYEASA